MTRISDNFFGIGSPWAYLGFEGDLWIRRSIAGATGYDGLLAREREPAVGRSWRENRPGAIEHGMFFSPIQTCDGASQDRPDLLGRQVVAEAPAYRPTAENPRSKGT